MKLIYVGPYYFTAPIFKSTTRDIIPGVYEPIKDSFQEIYLLTIGANTYLLDEVPEICPKIRLLKIIETNCSPVSYIKFIIKSVKFVKQNNIDVVTNLYGTISFGFDASIIGLLSGKRVVLLAGNNEILTRKILGKYNKLFGKVRYLFDKCREFIALNLSSSVIIFTPLPARFEDVKSKILNKKKVVFCPRGIDTGKYSPKARIPKKRKKFLVGYVGRKSHEKGFDLICEAAGYLIDKKDIEFIFVGSFEPGRDKNIRYCGYMDYHELLDVYNDLDVLLLPSRTEGFPRVVGHAMSMAKACIVSRHLFEGYFEDGKDAVFCEVNPKDIAEKILHLYNNPEVLEEISKNARGFVLKNLDSKKWGKVYRDVLLGIS